jgi:DNA transposition AAA+ family ATPase
MRDWEETETAADILRSLEMVHETDGFALTMIAGSPGVGKTHAVKKFCEKLGHDAIYIQAARGEGTAWNFAKSLASLWGYSGAPTFNTLAEARINFSAYIGPETVVVVDEAQYLNQRNGKTGQIGEAFEWLRAMAETGKFKLVFCGDLNLVTAINTMPQLQSRMLRPIIIKQASRKDVEIMVDNTAFATKQMVDALHTVARLKGGLRNVKHVTERAQLFAGVENLTGDHLRAAIIDMKLSPKGGV